MKRGTKTTIVGLVVMLTSLVLFLWISRSLLRGESKAVQFKAPGTFQTRVSEPGRYVVWDNHRTVFEGQRIDRKPVSPGELEIRIEDSNGNELEFVEDDTNSWGIVNHAKASVGYVDVQARGEVRIDVSGPAKTEHAFSFSKAELGQELRSALLPPCFTFLSGFAGLIIAIVGLIRMLRAPAASSKP